MSYPGRDGDCGLMGEGENEGERNNKTKRKKKEKGSNFAVKIDHKNT